MPAPTLAALAAVAAAAVAGGLVLLATRADPVLSPDSITYLAAGQHLHDGHGLTDFTGEALTVFPPVFPVLLAPGGADLAWAATVTALAVTAATLLMFLLLRHRVNPWVAVGAALALGAAQGMVRVGSTVWSETPYLAVALGTLVLLARPSARPWLAGALAGAGFLTRYAGAGLVLAGAAVVLVCSTGDLRSRARRVAWFLGAAAAACVPWLLRNLVATGEPLGPRFHGSVGEGWATLWWQPLPAIGELVGGPDVGQPARLGSLVVAATAVVLGGALAVRRSAAPRTDLAVAAFAVTSYVVPVLARASTASDIEYRVMSPMLVAVVYAAALVADALVRRRAGVVLAGAALALWSWQGIAAAAGRPDDLPASAGYRPQFAPQLYDEIDALAPDAVVMTNSPQRVWWFTRREPTYFGFVRPRPGNSHSPLGPTDTVRLACTGRAHLAWFDGLANAGDGPAERRPDLLALVNLEPSARVPGGTLYRVVPRPGSCEDG